jgi:hypothetical protein
MGRQQVAPRSPLLHSDAAQTGTHTSQEKGAGAKRALISLPGPSPLLSEGLAAPGR